MSKQPIPISTVFEVMTAFSVAARPLTISEVAEKTILTKDMATVLIKDNLIRDNYLIEAHNPNPEDGAETLYEMSIGGQEAIEKELDRLGLRPAI